MSRSLGLGLALGRGAGGGTAGVDPGGATGSTSSTTQTVTGCTSHPECDPGVCVFATGECADACDPFTPCGVGWVCNNCLTSSCPGCFDCLSGCAPAMPGQCDDHDDCGGGNVCIYGAQTCAPPCAAGGWCADPNLVCNPCATSSCPGCEDCVGACTASF
ncbi:MAG: hypothetical protein HY908_08190 [Myxococcales bacterium]|nr:hypothetical protein [Myxococcales bacterium]